MEALPVSKDGYYQEPHRPQFHFSPDSMWMNDPNGMVYYEGEYHLFYQYHPYSTVWGPMHWGHAVSTDLVHWQHLPIALYPDKLGLIFSGSAVVDWNNTSGFGQEGKPPLIAIFTHHLMEGEKAGRNDFQYQSIAYSLDKGRTWTKYEGNPVIPNPGIRDFRDPKVFWHEPTQHWIMIFAAADQVKIYSSPGLKDWRHESDFGRGIGAHGGVWECPDLFELPVDRNEENKKWVMLVSINPGAPNGGSGTQYFVGSFDGSQFTLEEGYTQQLSAGRPAYWLDYGRDNYAGVTWSDIPEEDGRRLFIGWMSNWSYANIVPTERWRSAMTVARTLELQQTPQGLRVYSNPVQELQSILDEVQEIPPQEVSSRINLSSQLKEASSTLDIYLELEWPEDAAPTAVAVVLSNSKGESVHVGLKPSAGQFFIDRRNPFEAVHLAPRENPSNKTQLRLLVDVSSVELFADGGKVVMTDLFFPNEDFTKAELVVEGDGVKVVEGSIAGVDSIW